MPSGSRILTTINGHLSSTTADSNLFRALIALDSEMEKVEEKGRETALSLSTLDAHLRGLVILAAAAGVSSCCTGESWGVLGHNKTTEHSHQVLAQIEQQASLMQMMASAAMVELEWFQFGGDDLRTTQHKYKS